MSSLRAWMFVLAVSAGFACSEKASPPAQKQELPAGVKAGGAELSGQPADARRKSALPMDVLQQARDAQRKSAEVARALQDAKVAVEDVRVAVSGGRATLSGYAKTEEDKARAAEVAAGVPGVSEVSNGIIVR